jgi:predicted dehydrogenase
MADGRLRVAVVGCGNISGRYGETLEAYDSVAIAGATDVEPERAAAFVARFGGTAWPSLDDVLADQGVDAVLNLTSHGAHAEVTARALQAGKHVHSEKPLAGSYAEAKRLLALADEHGVRLSSSPITFMGEAQETAWHLVETGAIGTVRVVYAEVNWGRIESWHPAPAPFYGVGPLVDVGVYPLTILTAIFGPARTVRAYGRVVLPDRTTASGEPFHVSTPDFGVAVIEMASGPVVRLTTSFYVGQHSRQGGIEFHGDTGSLHLASWQNFDSGLQVAEFGGSYAPVATLAPPFAGTDWGRALDELAEAIRDGRPHRAGADHAAHVIEILDAIEASVAGAGTVAVSSSFVPPAPPDGNGRSGNGHRTARTPSGAPSRRRRPL